MKMLIEYAYTYRRSKQVQNALQLLKTFYPFTKQSTTFIFTSSFGRAVPGSAATWTRSSNCLSMSIVADRYDDLDLLRVADFIAARNILLLAKDEELVSISAE